MAQTNTAARDYWNGLMQKHQGMNFFLTILTSIMGYLLAGVRYLFSGHWFVDLAKQIIIVGGRIATSVLFFAALWIAGRSTEPAFMGNMVSSLPALHLDPANLDSSAILAFTLLPEVILLGVLVLTIDLWVSVARDRRNGLAWIWASLYSLFAGIFMYIGIYTFCSFISTGHVPTTNASVDGMVLFRALTGWLYALVEMVHAGVSHRYHAPAQQQAAAQVPAIDINALITGAIADLQTKFEQSLNVIVAEQALTRTAIQQIQSAPATVPTIDTQAMIQAVMAELIPQFQAKFQAIDQTIFRQNATITEVANQAKHLPEIAASLQQIQAKRLPENAASQAAPKPQFQARPTTLRPTPQAEQNVLRLVPANASRDELKAEAIRLHTVEGMSSYKVAEKLGKSAKTVQSWLNPGKDQAESEENEAAN